MDALVALALILVGFALGGALVFVSLRRQYVAQIAALNQRIDRMMRADQVGPNTAVTNATEPPPPPTTAPPPREDDPRIANVLTAQNGPEDVLDRDTARMPAYHRPDRPLTSLPIPSSQQFVVPVPMTQSEQSSMPGSLVAPPIPGMTPPDSPSPHQAQTGPVSLPGMPLPISAPEVLPMPGSTPPPSGLRRSSPLTPRQGGISPTQPPLSLAQTHIPDRPGVPGTLPPPAERSSATISPGTLPAFPDRPPIPERRSTLPVASRLPAALPAARPATGVRKLEAASLLESSAASDPAIPNAAPRRKIPGTSTEPRVDLSPRGGEVTVPRVEASPRFSSMPRPDATLPMALEPPTGSVPIKRRQRDDDEITQLDPLEPELMEKLQKQQVVDAWAPSEPQLPYPRSDSVSNARKFEEPALPSRVGAQGEILRGNDASTNVLHIEENEWPNVSSAGGWEIDNLLGDFAKDIKPLEAVRKPSLDPNDEDDDDKGVFRP